MTGLEVRGSGFRGLGVFEFKSFGCGVSSQDDSQQGKAATKRISLPVLKVGCVRDFRTGPHVACCPRPTDDTDTEVQAPLHRSRRLRPVQRKLSGQSFEWTLRESGLPTHVREGLRFCGFRVSILGFRGYDRQP